MGEYSGFSLHEELSARFAEAENKRLEEEFLARGWTPPANSSTRELTPWERVGRGLKHDFEDMVYGAKKGLSGATFGASDWALRRLGITDDTYLAEREAEGLSGAVKGAGMAAELGGNMLGAGGVLVKGLGKAGLRGLKLAVGTGAAEGAAYGLTGSDSLSEVPQNMALGAAAGAAIPVGLHGGAVGAKTVMRPFSSRLMTEGLKRGQSSYRDYVAKHGTDEVLDFTPTKEQLFNYPGQSKFNLPEVSLSRDEAERILRNRAERSGVEIGGDIHHYTKRPDRIQVVRTLQNTLEKPDVVYSQKVKNKKGKEVTRDYLVKKYNGVLKGDEAPFFDFIIKEDGKLFNKFNTDAKYLGGQLQKTVNNVSINSRFLKPTGAGYIRPALKPKNTIPLRPIVVNSQLPHVNSVYEGLTEFQTKELQKALETGISKTNAKAGSLESMYNVGQAVNEQITQAQAMNNLNRLSQLRELKGRLDAVMPEGYRNAGRQPMPFGNFATPYWSGFVTRNPSLAAGLAAMTTNNIMQSQR